jgi:hypothetical protein
MGVCDSLLRRYNENNCAGDPSTPECVKIIAKMNDFGCSVPGCSTTGCPSDQYCDPGSDSCLPKKGNGQPCSSGIECISGNCDGGFCSPL